MADPSPDTTPVEASQFNAGDYVMVPRDVVAAMLAGQSGGGEFRGPVDPAHPEKGMMTYRMTEMELGLYSEKRPEKLIAALKKGIDVLDGIPDVLHTGDAPLMMSSFVNPKAEMLQSADYSLHVTIRGRLAKAAADLRTRAENAGTEVKPDTVAKMKEGLKGEVLKKLGIPLDRAGEKRIQNLLIREAAKMENDPRYRDPMIWQYLDDKRQDIVKAADAAGNITVEEYEKRHPEVLDPEIELIRSGLWGEFQARERLHNAWAERMTSNGSSDNKQGAARLFVDPNHTDIKASDMLMLFKDQVQAEHEDEALRAMVDVATGTEIKWANKGTPKDSKATKKEMWEVMLERRKARNPDVAKELAELAKQPGFENIQTRRQVKEALKQRTEVYEALKEAYEKELKAVSGKMDSGHGRLGEAMTRMAGTTPNQWETLKRDQRDLFANMIPEFNINERTGTLMPVMEKTLAKYAKISKYFEWKNPYPENFKTSEMFGEWFDYVLFRASGDVRAVYLAWRKFQLWEIISKPGIGTVFDEKKGPNMGDPPMVSDIAAWHYDFRRKREKEFGRILLADGTHKDLRGKMGEGGATRYAAGPPVTIDHIDALGKPFLDHAKGTVDGVVGKKSLWDLWYEMGTGLKDLPWMDTEDPKDWVGEDQEVAPHSFHGWLYQRYNAATVMEWLSKWSVSVPELLKVGDDGKLVVGKVVKAFDKTFGEMEYDSFKRAKKRMEGEAQFEPFTVGNFENPKMRGKIDPRAIAVLGWITQRHPDGPDAAKIPGDMARPKPFTETFPIVGNYETRGDTGRSAYESVDLLLDVLIAHGFISNESALELLKYCRLDSHTGVSRVNQMERIGGKPGRIEERIGKF